MALKNQWVRYVDRTYQQIKDRVLTRLHALVPEITDHSESNPFVKLLSIWAGIAEMLGYYIDNTAREAHLSTARIFKNLVLHAKAYNYRIHARTASTVNVQFSLDEAPQSDFTIPSNTILKANNVQFITSHSCTILAGETTAKTSAKQHTKVPQASIGESDGSPDQIFLLPVDLSDKSLIVRVNSVAWNQQETLSFSTSESQDFVQSVNEDGVPILIFGDGINGKIPSANSQITIEYYSTLGVNVEANTINEIVSNVVPPTGLTLSVTNLERSSGGQETVETIEQLRKRIPMRIRTNERAVTRRDFIEFCELKPEVIKAGLDFNCGKFVKMFIVPTGGGMASEILLQETKDWMDKYRIITTNLQVYAAGEVRILHTIQVNVLDGYTRSLVRANLLERLLDFYSPQNQKIKGSVHLSDIYEVIENTEGVDNSQITRMTPKPYAKPLNPDTPPLDWDRTILQDSTSTSRWQLTFISPTTFEVFKENNFIGQFNIQTPVELEKVTFTINTAGTLGDSYEFYTYPFFGTIHLSEQSLPAALEEDFEFIMQGGL